jgi:hypothetical protein
MYKISGADHARSEEVLRRVQEERNILEAIKRRKASWINHIVRRNCLLKYVIRGEIEENIEVTRRYGRSLSSYWMALRKEKILKLKMEALDRTLERNRFARACRTVVRQTTE